MNRQDAVAMPYFIWLVQEQTKISVIFLLLSLSRKNPAYLFYLARAVLAWCQDSHNTKKGKI